jgi:hypothetical protein
MQAIRLVLALPEGTQEVAAAKHIAGLGAILVGELQMPFVEQVIDI